MKPFTPFRKNVATLLNVLGLAVAFAAFIILMKQSLFDLWYDSGWEDADRIYRVEKCYTFPFERVEFGFDAGNLLPHSEITELTGIAKDSCSVYVSPTHFPVEQVENATVISSEWETVKGELFSQKGEMLDTAAQMRKMSISGIDFFGLYNFEGDFSRFDEEGTVVITGRNARKWFPDGNCIGNTIVLNTKSYDGKEKQDTLTVIAVVQDFGVMSSFADCDMITSLRNTSPLLYVKLEEGASAELVAQRMTKLHKSNIHKILDTMQDSEKKEMLQNMDYDSIHLTKLHECYVPVNNLWRSDNAKPMTKAHILFAIAWLILLGAFVNFVNFAIAVVPSNIQKINTMKVLGSSKWALRWQIFRQMALMSLTGYLLSLVLVWLCAQYELIPFLQVSLELAIQVPTLIVTTLIILGMTLLASVYPVFYSTSFEPAMVLKGTFATSRSGRWLRKILISLQMVEAFLFVCLLMMAFVQNHTFKTTDVGFETENVYVLSGIEDTANFMCDPSPVLRDLQKLPGIQDATCSDGKIMGCGDMLMMATIIAGKDEMVSINQISVAYNFFDFFGLKLKEGRAVDTTKSKNSYINELVQQKYHLAIADSSEYFSCTGVLADFHNMPLDQPINECMWYVPSNRKLVPFYFYIKTDGSDFEELLPSVRSVYQKKNFSLAHLQIASLEEDIQNEYQHETEFAKLVMIFSCISLFIMLIGVISITMLDIQYRRQENNIHQAFGASSCQVMWKLVGSYLIMSLICFAVAIPLAILLAKVCLPTMFFEEIFSWWLYLVAFLIVWIPVATCLFIFGKMNR